MPKPFTLEANSYYAFRRSRNKLYVYEVFGPLENCVFFWKANCKLIAIGKTEKAAKTPEQKYLICVVTSAHGKCMEKHAGYYLLSPQFPLVTGG